MFDTTIAVVGNVLSKPEWRRTKETNQLVANFRVASTARRYDREKSCWVDGNTLRVRVSAWRRLAENVGASISVGDPVVVFGRLYTRDWQDDEGNHRVSYEMEAMAIGPDLARGRTRFYRNKPSATSAVEGAEADTVAGGEQADAVTDAPVRFGEGLPELLPGEGEPDFLEVVAGLAELADDEKDEADEAAPAATESRRGRRSKREPVAA
ncbi:MULTISPECIES: single-stranded DNA-binding protein [Actinoplanes]|uniref:Single-stranded DNA-binding protein n=2 Tax=Actinoplanes TaxID=1865 RepID=A0A124G9X6_9ACTN|nr:MULTISPECIES: single-stranded DNA-binding protein [Actinoplanes]KUL30491.1 single-stranded DNA-binding protein [Actinoplanes awajinensis subsp. mycoplanecinus]GIE66443.1 hypothetical protein Apa02nite_025510 [Actinoplanes palleronii]